MVLCQNKNVLIQVQSKDTVCLYSIIVNVYGRRTKGFKTLLEYELLTVHYI